MREQTTALTMLRLAEELRWISDAELTARATQVRWEIANTGLHSKAYARVFPLVIEATRRVTGKSYFPVQVMAALQMAKGRIVEMQTGEGKTLTAALPVSLRAMQGNGMHVITANEYLATRDCELLRPVYALMGLSTSAVTADMEDQQRRDAYRRDITYSTSGEIGFDFLRDQLRIAEVYEWPLPSILKPSSQESSGVHRNFDSVLVDEADGILVDDASTPLIIGTESAPEPHKQALYAWCQSIVPHLIINQHFVLDVKRKRAELTEQGCQWVTICRKPENLECLGAETVFQQVERALTANTLYLRDRDYIVNDRKEVCIVDESTGRVMEDRKWQMGLHQAIEAKEGFSYSPANRTAATTSIQTLFRKYRWMCGMTGTAYSVRKELRRVYRTGVSRIPTHRASLRKALPDRIFLNINSKFRAIVHEIQSLVRNGRSVLIGTPSVEDSQALSAALSEQSLAHEVLNCFQHAEEAAIVGRAGGIGRITVATNMAGRGTDILLDDHVRANGGLHVIGTQRHSSARFDRQLVGRSARQGDPGSFQFFLSLEDEILRILTPRQRTKLIQKARRLASENGELPYHYRKLHLRCQRQVEAQNARDRRAMLRQEKDRLKSYLHMSVNPFIELIAE